MQAMLLAELRVAIVERTQRLRPDGLAVLTAGNISCRAGDLVAISPSAIDYDDYRPDLVTVVDIGGAIVEGEAGPSTELPMHLAAYRATGAAAVVHTHSPFATALACSTLPELPPIHYLVASLGGAVRITPYAPPGSGELARVMEEGLRDRLAVLLGNHGAVTIGQSLRQAYDRSLLLEWLCMVYARTLGLPGGGRPLDAGQLEEMVEAMGRYEQARGEPSSP